MFSYRHGFHAGNHADVLKHSVLLQVLDYFNQKPVPYWYIDTHAGAGIYDLADAWAEKTAEFHGGILRLWDEPNLPPMLQQYVNHIKELNEGNKCEIYPGSPWIAMSLTREKDKIRLFELHPNEFNVINGYINKQNQSVKRKIRCLAEDGFNGLKGLLPVPSRRAITLIDPSYEDKKDYAKALKSLDEGLQRFATGCYMIWYPIIARHEQKQFNQTLQKYNHLDCLNVSLQIQSNKGVGLHGSGLFIVNPPYTLKAELEQSMPVLCKLLAQDSLASFAIETSKAK